MRTLATHPSKAVIFGCAGTHLTDLERSFFKRHNPYAFILFARNCEDPEQVKQLVKDLRASVNNRPAPVLIDQEGGRVARFQPPHWREYPAARTLADAAGDDMALASELTYYNTRLIAQELLESDVNVDCLPLADVPVAGSHDIIGDRAYGNTPERVATLARAAAKGLLDGGVLPVLKHIPGHGRATVDSHEALPVVNASLDELRATDFVPFKALADLPLGMTAHVLYEAIDKENVATMSPTVIDLIRREIGFDGLLMTDDISMKALSGDIGELSKQAIAAGCDLVLHCNGDMSEMERVAEAVDTMSPETVRRAMAAEAQLKTPKPFDVATAEARQEEVLSNARAHAVG